MWSSLVNVNNNSTSSSSPDAAASSPDSSPIAFEDVIAAVPERSAAGALDDVSVHMCFICLLHLANERGLAIQAQPDLTTLTIRGVVGGGSADAGGGGPEE
jgi:hypothetical protein